MQEAETNEGRCSKKIRLWTAYEGFELLIDDLIFEILSWLPVKCLTRYMSVCKLWCSMIRSRKFIEKHMQHVKPFKRIVWPLCPLRRNPFWFLFTIDGLILEKSQIPLYWRIRNCATNWDLVLPQEGLQDNAYGSMSYLPSIDKYKVLSFRLSKVHPYICFSVLTVGVDAIWRPIEVPISVCQNEQHKLISRTLNGVSYIMKNSYLKSYPTRMVAFQTEDESFVQINVPGRVEVLCWTGLRFRGIECDNKFGIWCMLEGEFHIWILQDYKKAKWEKMKIALPSSFIKQYPDMENFILYKLEGTLVYMIPQDRSMSLCYDSKSKKYSEPSKKFRWVATSLVNLT